MKRPALWLWCSAGLVGVALVVVFGGWWAVRRWPYEIGPHLPPSLAIRLAGMGEKEFKAAQCRFLYDPSHPMSAAQIAACNAALCQGLRNSRDEQLIVLRLLYNYFEDVPIPATPERDALVFVCTTSPDPKVRNLARVRWTEGAFRPALFLKLRAAEISDNDHSPLSPDHWIAGRVAQIAWRMKVFTNHGHDHVTPSRYSKHLRMQLDLLLACEDGHGRFAADERDQAIAVTVLANLVGDTDDSVLKPVVRRAAAAIGDNRERLAQLWQNDTTTACLTAMCGMALSNAGIRDGALLEPLRSGFDAWWASRIKSAPPPWYAQGVVVEATVTERWGAAIAGNFWCASDGPGVASIAPPTLLDDLAPCSPFGRYLVMLGALARTDPRWEAPFEKRQHHLFDTMIITPDHRGLEGTWPTGGALSAEWETVFNALELTSYWPHELILSPPP